MQRQLDYYNRVSTAVTQFIASVHALHGLYREGEALDYLDPTKLPQATGEALTPEQQELAEQGIQTIEAFSVVQALGLFADIKGKQKVRTAKMLRAARGRVLEN